MSSSRCRCCNVRCPVVVLEGAYTRTLVAPRRKLTVSVNRLSRDVFCLFYDAKTKQVKALDGSGHSPEKLTIEHVRSRGITARQIPLTDLNSVTVPGKNIQILALSQLKITI